MKKGEDLSWGKDNGMPIMNNNEVTGNRLQEMPYNMLLAHSYVPWQAYEQAFSPREALMKGTLFPELWGVYPIPE